MPLPIVFGHHDLLPGNLMDDGKRLWLIDWEYGGFGTAMFDLANLSSNGEFDAAQDAALLDAYFAGKADANLRRAFAAMKAASALREALWAMVSDVHLQDARRRLQGACPGLSRAVREADAGLKPAARSLHGLRQSEFMP